MTSSSDIGWTHLGITRVRIPTHFLWTGQLPGALFHVTQDEMSEWTDLTNRFLAITYPNVALKVIPKQKTLPCLNSGNYYKGIT